MIRLKALCVPPVNKVHVHQTQSLWDSNYLRWSLELSADPSMVGCWVKPLTAVIVLVHSTFSEHNLPFSSFLDVLRQLDLTCLDRVNVLCMQLFLLLFLQCPLPLRWPCSISWVLVHSRVNRDQRKLLLPHILPPAYYFQLSDQGSNSCWWHASRLKGTEHTVSANHTDSGREQSTQKSLKHTRKY